MNLENTHWYIDGRDNYVWHMNILNFKMAFKSMILSNFVTKQLLTEHILYDLLSMPSKITDIENLNLI